MDLEVAMEASYDKPLWEVLFVDVECPDGNPKADELVVPATHWLDRRAERGDIMVIDPFLAEHFQRIQSVKEEHARVQSNVSEKEAELMTTRNKLDVAAETMLARQRSIMASSGTHSPEDTPLYQVHRQNILAWVKTKIDVLNQGFAIVLNERDRLKNSIHDQIVGLIEESYMHYLNEVVPHASSAVPDLGLMRELEKFMADAGQASLTTPHESHINFTDILRTTLKYKSHVNNI